MTIPLPCNKNTQSGYSVNNVTHNLFSQHINNKHFHNETVVMYLVIYDSRI